MKVRYMTQAAVDVLHDSLDDLLPFFADDTNTRLVAALRDRLNQAEVLRETNYVFPDAPLLESKESEDELANIRAVYLAMRNVPNAVAMDERLWAGLAVDLCWSYVRNRWDIIGLFNRKGRPLKGAATRVAEHFLFMHNPRRSFTRHGISRLWWLGRLTFDETLADPFTRTRIVARDLGYIVDLLERNFSNNRRISSEFVDAVEEARAEVAPRGRVILRPELRILCKYLNMLGGVYILDAMPPGEIKRKIHDKAVAVARQSGDPEPDAAQETDDDDL